jgi:hypothetical protein
MSGGIQERFEVHPLGRAIIAGLLLFIFGALLSSNMPPSELQHQINRLVEPVRNGVGLDQTWSVFAPEPRSQVWGLVARITYDDGTVETWKVPSGNPFFAEYRDYHWQKWSEQVRLDARQELWDPLAQWLVRSHDRGGGHPAEVTLIRRWRDLFAPGERVLQGAWHEEDFYTLQVTPQMLARR